MPRTLLSAVTLLVLSVGVVDTAHAHDPKLLDVLSAIDIVPTDTQATWNDAGCDLCSSTARRAYVARAHRRMKWSRIQARAYRAMLR